MTQILLILVLVAMLFGGLRARPAARTKALQLWGRLRRRVRGESDRPVADMTRCQRCSAYVVPAGGGCDRSDCPHAPAAK